MSSLRRGGHSVGRQSLAAIVFGLAALVLALVVVNACTAKKAIGVLDPMDFAASDGGAKFDPTNIVETAAFTDIESIHAAEVQKFFHRTPYVGASFLETYQSNGVRASDAIASAALNYRINPLVFLVFAEMTQGLVNAKTYPFPPERVEYLFRCGCLRDDKCLESFAGFDRQVDCLGKTLRAALDELKSKNPQKTESGWGPKVESTTLDNVKVSPKNESTAALYDWLPRVNEGETDGTWVFWNIWNLFAASAPLNYSGPAGGVDGRWIGEPCAIDSACGFDNAVCATNYPQGLCTTACTGDCPNDPNKAPALCAKFGTGGFCFAQCSPNAAVCRKGYTCLNVALVSGGSKFVCSADPTAKSGGSKATTEN